MKLTENDAFAAWREGPHDDLVFAVAIAAWMGKSLGRLRHAPGADGLTLTRRLGAPYRGSGNGHRQVRFGTHLGQAADYTVLAVLEHSMVQNPDVPGLMQRPSIRGSPPAAIHAWNAVHDDLYPAGGNLR